VELTIYLKRNVYALQCASQSPFPQKKHKKIKIKIQTGIWRVRNFKRIFNSWLSSGITIEVTKVWLWTFVSFFLKEKHVVFSENYPKSEGGVKFFFQTKQRELGSCNYNFNQTLVSWKSYFALSIITLCCSIYLVCPLVECPWFFIPQLWPKYIFFVIKVDDFYLPFRWKFSQT